LDPTAAPVPLASPGLEWLVIGDDRKPQLTHMNGNDHTQLVGGFNPAEKYESQLG
jgi:hypothetical protein